MNNQPQNGGRTKREQTPEMAFNYEEEARPSTIEISLNTTEAEPEQQVTTGQEDKKRKETDKIERPE